VQTKTKRFTTTCAILLIATTFLLWRSNRRSGVDVASAAPTQVQSEDTGTPELTMSDVLEMAVAAQAHMAQNLDDYTARFVKQEADTNGVLGEETEMLVKVQTRLRGNTEHAPMRVYLSFQAPESLMGREVIWAEDLHDGKMAVHEVGFLLSLKTIWLDPNGMIAMQGQRYPISEIGMVRLVEKLIERGERDRDNPDISVTVSRDHMLGDTPAQLIQVRRAKPSSDKDDFSLAEIVIDQERQLILKYRSFGWPDTEGSDPPLIESYFYDDVQTNIGLSEADFDPANPNYNYPLL
jgi:hypothetical protein